MRGLTKSYGGQLVVDRVSFDVPPGRVVGFLGPNGAGKSTTMRMIIGLTAPSSGEARILGTPFAKLDDPVHTVGSIVDGVGHHPGRRAIEELRVNARAVGIPLDRCDEVLELVGLENAAHKRVGAYSLGMRQRLGIAQAMLGDPRVLLLDEPANGLDPQGILWVRRFLRRLADEGRSILVSSHLINEVARLADDVIVIRQGRIVTEASVAQLTAVAGGAAVSVASNDDVRLHRVLAAEGAEVAAGSHGLTVRNLPPERIGELALQAGVALRELRPMTAELEDVFMELTAGGEIA
ncbi:ABC transporter ATP-binding protein [Egicoccus sp. AB-alg6-2]|uniref:ABC transporter ATP-binding protein n=1 Tax=Egicoccus sp. AB-alg6-2 TaxID=3242692 RepID=UPI00359D7443